MMRRQRTRNREKKKKVRIKIVARRHDAILEQKWVGGIVKGY